MEYLGGPVVLPWKVSGTGPSRGSATITMPGLALSPNGLVLVVVVVLVVVPHRIIDPSGFNLVGTLAVRGSEFSGCWLVGCCLVSSGLR